MTYVERMLRKFLNGPHTWLKAQTFAGAITQTGAVTQTGAITRNGALIPDGCTFVVGAAHTSAVLVSGVVKAGGVAIDHAATVEVFLSDSAAGLDVTGATPDGNVVITTNGFITASVTAKIYLKVQTDITGKFDITVNHTGGADDWYMVVVINGVQFVSGKIEITA